MRLVNVSSDSLRGCHVRLGRQTGFVLVVTASGDLILRTPATPAAARRRLLTWGVQIAPGALPAIRRTVAVGTEFQHRVWLAARAIPVGQTRTYGELAKAIGCKSAQAVGTALCANPLAILIPCHRIVSRTGPGGFAWGLRRKQAWLAAERRGTPR